MIKPAVIAGFLALVGIGCMLAPPSVTARSSGSHASAHAPTQSAPNWSHRRTGRFIPYGYSYYPLYSYYGFGGSENTAPLMPREKPVAEIRRACEPQTYAVPSEAGGESKVTIVRC